MASRKNQAFTLVELLVVIAIIALLLSILMPSLGRAREQARKVVCQSNLKQINLSLQMYAMENKSTYPHEFMMTAAGYYRISYGTDFRPLVEKYGAGGKVFYCPSGGSYWADAKTCVRRPNDKFGWNKYSGIGVFSYSIWASEGMWAVDDNEMIDWFDGAGKKSDYYRAIPFQWKQDNIKHSAEQVMAQDLCFTGAYGIQCLNHPRAFFAARGGGEASVSSKETGAGFNNVYYDGHVQWRGWKDRILMGQVKGGDE